MFGLEKCTSLLQDCINYERRKVLYKQLINGFLLSLCILLRPLFLTPRHWVKNHLADRHLATTHSTKTDLRTNQQLTKRLRHSGVKVTMCRKYIFTKLFLYLYEKRVLRLLVKNHLTNVCRSNGFWPEDAKPFFRIAIEQVVKKCTSGNITSC